MILVDTSVWIDHLRSSDSLLVELLNRTSVLIHPFVVGELSLGNLKQRPVFLEYLRDLPSINVATDDEVQFFVDKQCLHGLGIGYIDAYLLTAVFLNPGTSLWTRDKRLLTVTERLLMAAKIMH